MPLTHNTDHLGKARSRYPAQYIGKPRFDAIVQAFSAEVQELEDAMWAVSAQRLLQKGPAQIVGRAYFTKTQTATLYWPWPLNDTSYLMIPGKAVVTDASGPVAIAVDETSKTTTSVVLNASSLFTGYVSVLAWNPGEDPLARGVGGDILDKLGKLVGQPRNGMTDSEYLIFITARIAANRSDGRRETLIRLAKLLVPGATVYVKDFAPAAVLVLPQTQIQVDPYVAAQFMEIAKSAGVYIMFGWTTQPFASTLMLGYSVANGTTVPTTAQSPGWSGTGSNAIAGGALAGIIAG